MRLRYRELPGSELEPEAVRLALQGFLRYLVKIERDRDQQEAKARQTEEQIADLTQRLTEKEHRVGELQTLLNRLERGN